MAVYTKVSDQDLNEFLEQYSIGYQDEFSGIQEGIENSNYLIKIKDKKYILTIFEKRTSESDLPFFFQLINHLKEQKIKCPEVVLNKQNKYYSFLKNKPAAITTFLEGQSISRIEPIHCAELGNTLALFHNASNLLDIKRENKLGFKNLKTIISSLYNYSDRINKDQLLLIDNEYQFLIKNIFFDLPKGIIHADLFPDNVFFQNNSLSGIIDFYFACNDFYAYEIAICLNAWCFEINNNQFNVSKAKALLSSYNKIRRLSEAEVESLPLLARAASLRFLLTRLVDYFQETESLLLTKKDPNEYFEKLRFHQTVKKSSEYGL